MWTGYGDPSQEGMNRKSPRYKRWEAVVIKDNFKDMELKVELV